MRRTETSGHFYFRMPRLEDRDQEGFPRLHPFGVMAMRVETKDGKLGVRVASSLCHPNDEFRKNSGRNAAYGKLESHTRSIFIERDSGITFESVIKMLHPRHTPSFESGRETHEDHFQKLMNSLLSNEEVSVAT